MDREPIIGITCRRAAQRDRYFVLSDYVHAVRAAGGVPVLLPVDEQGTEKRLVALTDGLLLTGGPDVSPLCYGEEPHPKMGASCRKNDCFEMELIRETLRQGKPILGICRGMQLLNVYYGGTLYQDIPSQTQSGICHAQSADARGETTHSAHVHKESALFRVLGSERVEVNSYHHQAACKIGAGLIVNASAPDGLVEGVETADGQVLAVQWHPESIWEQAPHAKLFSDFVARCRRAGHERRNQTLTEG